MAAVGISSAKRSLRAELKQRLRALSAEERLRQSHLLTQKTCKKILNFQNRQETRDPAEVLLLLKLNRKQVMVPRLVVGQEVTRNYTPAERTGSHTTHIKQIFCKNEEFENHNEGSWEEYKSYVAQVGYTDIEEQQKINSKESFPDATEVQQWELRKISSTTVPVLIAIYVAPPPKSSNEDNTNTKNVMKRRRKRHYYR